ncbi:FecR family protein [Nitrobacter winogradskyi]|uniref:Transmembrane sensor n=2 Tax=Nitrobacter winogradskyi TaxID=913 RepID=A0ACC6AF38_NITWI|nr:FecR domain-containing protein [Nitrobacter winogradskyi]MCP1998216.1 transmembrane sensor [Nitrobacter winogradskyi]GEC15194.1 iron dicitrate transporter FecR [Nitrobacter winogradskyi]
MTEAPAEDRRLFREAADLAIRLQNDPANPVSIDMVRTWVARSSRHEAAWARVAAIHGMTGRVLTEQRAVAEGGVASMSRRTLVIGGLIGAGVAAAGSLTVPGALLRARADYMTSTAEIRRITLSDGSEITLGPDSAVAIDFADARRTIGLLAGMAYFDVARNAARPFSVLSGDLTATALGTAFDVSNDAGFVSVSVNHGAVEARAADSALRLAERLNPGDWITFDTSSHAIARGTREASQIAAWREGMIVAERETVSAMVAKISRWQPGRVVMADPFLGSRVVSGVFDLADPLGALEAVVRPFGAKVRTVTPFMTIISPV